MYFRLASVPELEKVQSLAAIQVQLVKKIVQFLA
jgi:hypothetical protein